MLFLMNSNGYVREISTMPQNPPMRKRLVDAVGLLLVAIGSFIVVDAVGLLLVAIGSFIVQQ
jgi:hypothetical protein